MKRLVVALTATLAAAALVAGTGSAGDKKGPPCTDIVFGDFGYADNGNGTGTVSGYVLLATTHCGTTSYNLFVQGLGSDAGEVDGVDATQINFSFTFASLPASVCVYVESVWRDHTSDRAPDTGCEVINKTDSGGGSGFS